MGDNQKSNGEIKYILQTLLRTDAQTTMTPADLINILNGRCYPKNFDYTVFRTLLSKQGVLTETKLINLAEFIEQYVEFKDSTEFAWLDCKNRIDALATQRDRPGSNLNTVEESMLTFTVTLWIRNIVTTTLRKQLDTPCTVFIEYQTKLVGQTSPYKFRDNVCVINEQLSVNVRNDMLQLNVKLMNGKVCIGMIFLDLSKFQSHSTQELQLPFLTNKQNPLSNEYQMQAMLMFVQPESLNDSSPDAKQLQETQTERQAMLFNIMAPLVKPLVAVRLAEPAIKQQMLESRSFEEEQKQVQPIAQFQIAPLPQQTPNYKVPSTQYHNQPFSQFQLAPPLPRRHNDYPKESATQTHAPVVASPPIDIAESVQPQLPSLDYESYFEVSQGEIELLKILDDKLPIQSRTHAHIFILMTLLILGCSILINFFRIQMDVPELLQTKLLIILFMWLLFRTNQLNTKALRYIFVAFLINIFIDIVWLCQVNGVIVKQIAQNWAQISSEPDSFLKSAAQFAQKLLIPIKIIYAILLWRISVHRDQEFLATLQRYPCLT